jgi:long-chain fatty acid transport protein
MARAVLVGATLASSSAEASEFLNARFGSDDGNPVAQSPFAVYYNPAGIAGIKGTQLSVDGSLVYRHASYDRTASALSKPADTRDAYVRANTGKATLNNILTLPFLGIGSKLGTKNFAVGYAFYVPFGGQAKWDKNDSFKNDPTNPGAADGQARWSSISGSAVSLYNTIAAAVNTTDGVWSFGINASLIHTTLNTVRARNGTGDDQTLLPSGSYAEGRSLLEASGFQFGLGAGIMFMPTPELKVGLSYTARPNFGEMRLKGDLKTQLGTQPERGDSVPVDVLQTFPDVIRLGASYQVSKDLMIRGDVNYVTWSALTKQCVADRGADCNVLGDGSNPDGKVRVNIPREWQDAYGFRLGAVYGISDTFQIFGSGAYDSSATPDKTLDATYMDAKKVIGTLGVRKQFGDKVGIAASFAHVQFFTVDTTGKGGQFQYAPPSKSPSGDGIYKQTYDLINLNGTYSF